MKNQVLSIEQMKHLKELGVNTCKASMVLLFSDEYGECVRWEVENHGKEQPLYEFYDEEVEHWISTTEEYFDADTGNYDHSYRESYGVFTLQDMLEMMPDNIRINYLFKLSKIGDSWLAGYFFLNTNNSISPIFSNPRLIDLTYNFLCWLAENRYLEGGKP